MSQTRSKTIVNNTILLYIRSFVTMFIGIFTSRVLLSILGVEDYGTYNLVGGIVAMFASLKVVFASAIQRFLNYEKGTGVIENVQKVFNLGLIVQSTLALLFFIVVEIIGLWFINNKLNIPEHSISDAYFIFHFSTLTAVLAIMTSPFDATIIANEKMSVFAWLTMVNSALKLGIVYLLPILGYTYLRSYSVLLFVVTIADITFNIWYCRRFPECKFSFIWDKILFKKIAAFSGWNFMGNTAYSFVNEGINLLLNIFGGVAYNASRAIAYQVKGALSILSSNITVASRPFIVQQSVTNDKKYTYNQICRLSRLVFIVVALTVFPFIVYTDYVLNLWLIEPPIMSAVFVRISLLHLLIRSLHEPIDTLFKTFGQIGRYQIFDSLTLALSLPLSYIVLSYGMPKFSVFIVITVVEIITLITLLILIKKQFKLSICFYLRNVVLNCIKTIISFCILGYIFYRFFQPHNLFQFVCCFCILGIIELVYAYFCLLEKEDKFLILNILKKRKK